jgi:hypothetical protein
MSYTPTQIHSIAYLINFLILIKRLKDKNIIKRNGTFPDRNNMENIKNGYRAHMISALKKYIQHFFPTADIKKERVGLKFKVVVKATGEGSIKDDPLLYRLFLEAINGDAYYANRRTFNLGLFTVDLMRPYRGSMTGQSFDIIISMKEKDMIGQTSVANSIDLVAEELNKPFSFAGIPEADTRKACDRTLSATISRMNSYGWLSIVEPEYRKREPKTVGQFEGIGVSKFSFDELLNSENELSISSTNLQDAVIELTANQRTHQPSIAETIRQAAEETIFNNFIDYYQSLLETGNYGAENSLRMALAFFPNIVRGNEITTNMMETWINT